MSLLYFPKIHLPHFHHTKNDKIEIKLSGKLEILKFYRINITRGLILSVTIHLFLLSTYFIYNIYKDFSSDERIVKVRILKYSDLGPPPSLSQTSVAPKLGVASTLKPSIGVPIPVPDAEVNPENTIATQTELSSVQTSSVLNDNGVAGGEIIIEGDLDEPGMDEFIPVENPPQIIHSVQPEYPDIARRAGIEGTVWVKILVGKDGKPIKSVVMQNGTNKMFEDAAMAAAMKYAFTPATMSHGPVKVWVAIKFKFQLTTSKSKN